MSWLTAEKPRRSCDDLREETLLVRDGERRRRCIAVGDGGAEVRDVHRPTGHGASEERNHARGAHHEKDGVRGRAVLVEDGEPAREDPLQRHGVHQAARGDERGDDARQLRGEHRAADHGHARRAQRLARRGKHRHRVEALEAGERGDVVRPVRIAVRSRQDGQKREQQVNERRERDRRDQQDERALDGEAEFAGRVDDGLEPDERPRNHGEDADDLQPGIAVRRERRRQGGESARVPSACGAEADRHA